MTKGVAQGFPAAGGSQSGSGSGSALRREPAELIAWHDGLVLGMAEMDRQHRELLARVNALADALLHPDGEIVRLACLEDLVVATHRHFDWEEGLMAAHGYAHQPAHREQHTELLGMIERLRDDLKQRGHAVNRPGALRFLADWFRVHIAHSDAEFVASVRREPAGTTAGNENGHPRVAV